MSVTMENTISQKSLADRESALRTISAEIDAINNLNFPQKRWLKTVAIFNNLW